MSLAARLRAPRAALRPSRGQGATNAGVVARRLIVEGQRNKRLQKSLDDDALVDGIPAPLSTGLLDNSAVAANFALLRRVLGSVGRDVAIFDVPRLQARYWN